MTATFSLPATERPGPRDTRWITGTVALFAIAVFTVSGSQIMPAIVTGPGLRHTIDPGYVSGFLLNIALILFAWRRSEQLKQTFAERDEAERKAYALAYFDEVTGLLNRRHLREVLVRASEDAIDRTAIALIDLDHFKKINDLYGHQTGDAVLVIAAERLKATCPPGSTCVRLGGDEFAVLLHGEAANQASAVALGEAMLQAINKPIKVGKTVTAVGASIGIAALAEPCRDPQWLLKRADIAMYEAKTRGRNRCVCFDPAMETELERRSLVEADVRRGILAGEFVPFFQPMIDLESGNVRGFEVLARWQHPQKGLMEPPEFLELAEATGMISELSFKVMHDALAIARDWPSHFMIAVNVSPVQFNDPFMAARVLKVLSTTRFPAERLELEIRERTLLDNYDQAIAVITSLKNSGISVSVDDFGVGYASLTQLRALPFDRMKLDRSYMSSLSNPAECDALIQAVSAVGRGLNVPMTAEGVESEAVHAKLRELGCVDAQGWLFGRALSAEDVRHAFVERASPINIPRPEAPAKQRKSAA